MGVGLVVQVRLINLRPGWILNQLQVIGIEGEAYLSIFTLGVGFINLGVGWVVNH